MQKRKCVITILLCLICRFSFGEETKLSLDETILLAVRSNPNVEVSRLSYSLQQFNLQVQRWQFHPHYALQTSASYSRSRVSGLTDFGSHVYSVQPSASLLTPLGTTINTSINNNYSSHYNPGLSVQVSQPLMRGFGPAVVEAALNNAKDSEVISRLSVEGALRDTITLVIGAYLDVMAAERSIQIDEDALKRAKLSVKQTKVFIKAGHKAGNEIVTVQANVASAQSQLVNDKNNLLRARYALLSAIGIDPNSAISFKPLAVEKLITKYHGTSIADAKKLILQNDIQYQTDNITLHGATKRNVLTAEDNSRWDLNLTANAVIGGAAGGGQNAGINSIYNGMNQTGNAALVLQIPIDDQASKQAVLAAQVALKEAELNLQQEKWSKQTEAINGANDLMSAKNALVFAEDAESLTQKTYHITYQKYLHGLIDSMEWQTAQNQLSQSQQTLLLAQMGYLRALVNFDLLIGNTLNTWHIPVRL